MQFARPPDGFTIFEHPNVLQTLNNHRAKFLWLDQAYRDALARLKMSGHKEGRPSSRYAGLRSVVEIDPITGFRRLGISYSVLGDEITIHSIRVLAD